MRTPSTLSVSIALLAAATSCSDPEGATEGSSSGGATGSAASSYGGTTTSRTSHPAASGGEDSTGNTDTLVATGGATGRSSNKTSASATAGATHKSSGTSDATGGATHESSGKTGGDGSGGATKGSGGTTHPASGGTSAGGAGATTTGATSTPDEKICKFSSGLNVAWVNFAADVPSPNIATFSKIFKDTYDNGGRIVRWWFHTNGTSTPGYNSDGTVKKIPQSHIDDVKKILAAADAAKIGVVISLWSFDMAQDNAGSAATQNKALLTTDALRQSYIDNYLTDLVKGLKGTKGLYAYEIFNEPEGMETTGWATQFKLDKKYIQMAVNWWSAAIHAADPTVPVTSSAQTMDSCSGVSGKRNDYSDSALASVGGKTTGTLDFYEVHYYQVNGESNNVFANPRSHWALDDKPLVIGEFAAYANDTSPVAVNDSFTYLFTQGYDGAWAWSYTEGNSNYAWPTMKTPMKNLYTAQTATVDACP